MIDLKQLMNSAQDSSLFSQLKDEGLSPDKVQEAVQATAEGAAKHGASAGLDFSSLLGGAAGGGLGALTGALGMGSASPQGSAPQGGSGALAKLTGPVIQYVVQKGFPQGVAERVVNAVLPKLLGLAQKH